MRFTTWLVLIATLLLWSGNWIVARPVRVAISFVGVLLIATHGDIARLSFNVGDLMALASMVMWAGYTVLLRVKRDPLEVIELLCMVCAFGVLFMAPWLFVEAITGVTLRL